MKIFKILFLLAVVLNISGGAAAAPAYGTRLLEAGKIQFGLETYRVSELDLEDNFGRLDSVQYFGLLSYGLTDWLTVDLKGGLGDVDHQPAGGSEIHFPTYLGGGYGFRLRLLDREPWKAVFGFQHISVHPYSINLGPDKQKVVLDDWQLSLLVSRKIRGVTPYAGVKLSRMDYIRWINTVDRKRIQPDNNLGAILGLEVPFGERLFGRIEGQWLDAAAMSASVEWLF